jgi:hypothetical protein
LIKCATIIYLMILIEILIYQHLITITEDRVKYVGEINYVPMNRQGKHFLLR